MIWTIIYRYKGTGYDLRLGKISMFPQQVLNFQISQLAIVNHSADLYHKHILDKII